MSQQTVGRTVMVQGRIVWVSGDLFKGRQKTDQNTKQVRRNAAGEVMMEYGFGLAVPVESLAQTGPGQPGEIWAAIHAEAMTLYPNGQIPPSFAMKYKDGVNGVDDKGVPFNKREGYAGHLVFACTTSLPIKYFKWENGGNVMISEGIKCGDYVKVQLQIKAHPANGQSKAGLYLNPNMVQFLGYGKEIVNTPNGDAIFGNAAPAMPAGATAMPMSPGPMPGQPFAPPQAGYAAPAAMPQQVPSYQQPPPVAAAPAPHFQVLPPAHQPHPGGQPMAHPGYPPPVGQMPAQAPYFPPQNFQPQAPAIPQHPGMPPMPGYPQQ